MSQKSTPVDTRGPRGSKIKDKTKIKKRNWEKEIEKIERNFVFYVIVSVRLHC